MPQIVIKKLVSLIGLEGVFLVAVLVYLGAVEPPQSLPASLRFFPYAVLAAALLASWRFHRSRLLFGTLVFAMADAAIRIYSAAGPEIAPPVYQAVAFLVPINLVGLSWIKERGTFTPLGQARLGAILVQAAMIILLASTMPGWVGDVLTLGVLPKGWFGWTPIGQPALLLFATGSALLIVRLWMHANATGRGFLWAMMASFFALQTVGGDLVPTVYFSTGVIILIVSVIEASYFMAYRDGLTGLPARRALNEELLRLNGKYTIAMVDVDRFKTFNDRYGHDVGDQILRKVAAQLEQIGGGGKAFRYGGEEFALVFAGKSQDEVFPHLEALRAGIADEKFALRGKDRPKVKPEKPRPSRKPPKRVSVTVSIGAASRSDARSAPSEVITFADQALYRAKKAGRNRVKVAKARR
jgi:diguanylate cyclase (GGDEF)-like protein